MKNRFQSLPFKCNLQRYIVDKGPAQLPFLAVLLAAGLYTLNSVRPISVKRLNSTRELIK